MNGIKAPLKSTFSHGLVGYCCQWWDPTTEGTRDTCVGTKPPCHVLLCNTLVCLHFHKVETDTTQMRKAAFLKIQNEVTNSFLNAGLRDQDFLLLDSQIYWDWPPLPSLSAGSWALPLQRELLVALAVQPYFEFIVLFLFFSPSHLNKEKARALQGWQLMALASASHVNSIRRVAAGPRKAVVISESFERCGVVFFLLENLQRWDRGENLWPVLQCL